MLIKHELKNYFIKEILKILSNDPIIISSHSIF
jgi:hypothetical protein